MGASLPAEIDLNDAATGRMQLLELLDRAQALQQAGRLEEAVALYERWTADTRMPMRHIALYNLGTLLAALKRHDAARQAYEQALQAAPEFAQARLNLGHELERAGQPDAALGHWQEVLDVTFDPALRQHALNNKARLLEQLKRYDEAERHMVLSLQHQPRQPDVIQHYVHIRQKQCEWPVWQPVGEVTPNQLLTATSPLAMLGLSDDPALQLMAAQRFVREKVPPLAPVPLHTASAPRTGRIRVGYLSGDLCLHAAGLLSVELIELHDRSRFEVYGFCWSREDGTPQRRRIVSAFDHLVLIGTLDDDAAARLIAAHGIDVLVDLQGLTHGARPGILVQRPAPVQVSYLGLPGTSAIPGVDWIVADRVVMPAEQVPYYTEQPLYLPHCYQVSDRQREVGPTPTRAAAGLPEDAFVFCSFNNTFKFTEEVFATWMRVLHAVPGSVLWLLADNVWARENLLRAADAHGVARERLIFASRVSPADYLARFQLADLMLDTFPYNAGTTASDALWMGTPIVTCAGRAYISRMAASLLSAVGLPDLVTESLDAYEKLAIRLGREPARAASYRRYLTEHVRQSALFDVPQIVRDLEAGFERLALHARAQA